MNSFIKRSSLCILALAIPHSSWAGTILTDNLPSDTEIVNIDARSDGAFGYNYDQSRWSVPFGSGNKLTLSAGTYSFKLVNPADAHAMFPALTAGQLAQIYTAWTYNSPWLTDYCVMDDAHPYDYELFSGAVLGRVPGLPPTIFTDAQTVYDVAKAGGVTDKIYVGGRVTGTEQTTYTLNHTMTLDFVIPDWGVYDNTGGVSVVVHREAVPEPASAFALLIGATSLVARRRRSQVS